MPYFYPVQVKESALQGKGVFALEDIPAGVVIWAFAAEGFVPVKGTDSPKENLSFTKEEFLQVCSNSKLEQLQDMAVYGIYHRASDRFLYFRQGCQYTNHSKHANMKVINYDSKNPKDLVAIVTKEIKKGEEITEKYEEYLSTNQNYADWASQFVQKYNPGILQFERSVLEEEKEKA